MLVLRQSKRQMALARNSAIKILYDGQFALSTPVIKPHYLVIPPIEAAQQFLWKLEPLVSSKFIILSSAIVAA